LNFKDLEFFPLFGLALGHFTSEAPEAAAMQGPIVSPSKWGHTALEIVTISPEGPK
jgi:hypothetical protein